MLGKVNEYAAKNNLRMPSTDARQIRTPARLRQTTQKEALAPGSSTSILAWRREFYQTVDLVSSELERRFNQETMTLTADRERAVTAAASGSLVDLDTLQLPKEIDTGRLNLQLKMMQSVTGQSQCTRVKAVASVLNELHPQTRALFSEVDIHLCLCVPVSVASSERSFSNLRRLKTWLRSTMTQKRLTHLSLMNVHCDILNALDIKPLMKDFIGTTPERQVVFGVIN
ncbi:hypothetical protein ACEWY4_005868 [Coilia grayii]|uniref:HAT C-terminal dimerisation domain-containing protein n=1 Tax=Coilia grayii TaxID=363190 RepID=A0ABD1KJS3_9TELE